MDLPSPVELGEAMHLVQDGSAASVDQMSRAEAATQANELLMRVQTIAFDDDSRCQVYKEEFRSLYLLSLARSLLSSTAYKDMHKAYLSTTIWMLNYNAHGPAGSRLVREHSQVSTSLYLYFGGALTMTSEEADRLQDVDTRDARDLRRETTIYFVVLSELAHRLFSHLPTGTLMPPLSPDSRIAVLALCDRVRSDGQLFRSWLSGDPSLLRQCETVLRLIAQRTTDLHIGSKRPTFENSGKHLLWWDCQLRVGPDGVEEPAVKCRVVDEMMACSRCGAVRYCSKEHQKADWKRHKKLCFQPTW